ncbi:MAG: hypothetical protein A3G43_12395 [Ignavibacteria bacterium RIFCSPLOWO2_12_FULL_56_21]|nr:MAG: hypothetical protein A3G43_12395 [Ignavibacteria bacterium RIFCSPLOWO2_12_FULL_56_21]
MILSVVRNILVAAVSIPISSFVLVGLLVDRNIVWFHRAIRFWARSVLGVCGVRVHVQGTERLKPGEAYIFAANHASMFDIPAVITCIPADIHIVYKKELTHVPIWGWALALSPYIIIDRANARDASGSLESAAAKIRDGKSVMLFPEGTRTRTGSLQPFKRGTFALAVRSGVPVVPVTINNTYGILRKGSLAVRSADIEVILDAPIPTLGREGKEGELALMEEVRRAMASNYIDQSGA